MISTATGIDIQRVAQSRLPDTDLKNLKFGRVFTDHMFVMDYADGAWGRPRIEPFKKLELSPATLVLHYAQTIFEGMKAYRTAQGDVVLFRPDMNIARMNRSTKRMCMPQIPEDVFMAGLKELVALDAAWMPDGDDAALYIRPFMYASDEYIGVKPSDTYRFMIFICPVRAYYADPLRVYLETKYSRAFPGGTGEVKCGGNYAGVLYPTRIRQNEGYHQQLWTDGVEHKYIEESGTMNAFFIFDGVVTTPALDGTILPGITRNSILTLAREMGLKVEERLITVDEVIQGVQNGKLNAAFGAGTAATIAPIKTIGHEGVAYDLPDLAPDSPELQIAQRLDDIRRGRVEDTHGWVVKVD